MTMTATPQALFRRADAPMSTAYRPYPSVLALREK